jgi:superfamily II DNA or RNA helicase
MLEIIKDNVQIINGLNKEQRDRVKKDLLLDNPQYLNAKKYTKWDNVKIPPYLKYYEQEGTSLLVPLCYAPPFKINRCIDKRQEHTVSYPPFVFTLRDTQKEAVQAYLDYDCEKGLIVMSTGKGKSITGIYLAKLLRQKTLIIVHKDDLVKGWTKDIKDCFNNKVEVGLIKGKSRKIGKQITIATVQTLSRMPEEEIQKLSNTFGLLIGDEMHHVPASTYNIINEFSTLYRIGLSATPERSDGLEKVMNWFFGDMCFECRVKGGDEDILPVKILRQEIEEIKYYPYVVKRINRNNQEYWALPSEKELPLLKSKKYKGKVTTIDNIEYKKRPRVSVHNLDREVLHNPIYAMCVAKDIAYEVNKGHSCIAFFSQKEACEVYQKAIISMGVPEEQVQLFYGDSKESAEVLMKRAEDKEVLLTLATYSKASEGTNVKAWEVAFLVSSVADGKGVEQAIGRIRRTKKGKINPAIVYDYRVPNVYILKSHGAKRDTRYRLLGLESSKSSKKSKPKYKRGWV